MAQESLESGGANYHWTLNLLNMFEPNMNHALSLGSAEECFVLFSFWAHRGAFRRGALQCFCRWYRIYARFGLMETGYRKNSVL